MRDQQPGVGLASDEMRDQEHFFGCVRQSDGHSCATYTVKIPLLLRDFSRCRLVGRPFQKRRMYRVPSIRERHVSSTATGLYSMSSVTRGPHMHPICTSGWHSSPAAPVIITIPEQQVNMECRSALPTEYVLHDDDSRDIDILAFRPDMINCQDGGIDFSYTVRIGECKST